MGDCFRHYMYTYILYVRYENSQDTIYTCHSVHGSTYITTTIAGEWLNSLIFHDNNNCITAIGQTVCNADADNYMLGGNNLQNIIGCIKST